MTPTDASGVARVVGFYEYANALNNFDTLVNQLDDDELAAIDEIVAERDEYTVFVTAPMAEPQDQQAGGERRGFAWVMALARLELASMLATLTNTPAPFQAVKPTKLEFDAYVQLLLEGARAHYEALARDPILERVTKMSPAEPTVLAYARRLVLRDPC